MFNNFHVKISENMSFYQILEYNHILFVLMIIELRTEPGRLHHTHATIALDKLEVKPPL